MGDGRIQVRVDKGTRRRFDSEALESLGEPQPYWHDSEEGQVAGIVSVYVCY